MRLKRKNITRKIGITLIAILLMGSSIAFGAGFSKQITAWYYNIQVKLDGRALTFTKEPFIYDGSVYIPLRDVSQNLGLEVAWEDATKTVILKSNGTYNQYYNNQYNNIINNSSDSVEDELNSDYDEYTKGKEDLEFKYDLSEKSTYIKVKMDGENFKKDSSDWDDRDDSDFQDFVEDIAKIVADDYDEDVKIYIYDEDNEKIGEYEYDESKNDFEVVSEYSEEIDLDDLEDDIEDEYEEYKKGAQDLEFSCSLSKSTSYIKVKMNGKNFKVTESAWSDRDDNDFEDYAEDIAGEVYDEIDDMDVKVYIYDEDNTLAAKYIYDESDDDFTVEYEYGEEDSEEADEDDLLDDIDDTLEDNYETYTGGDDDLEFKYTLSSATSYIKVEVEGKNFDKNGDEWEDRDEDDFQDFIEDIAEEVYEVIDDKDVKIYVYDDDDDEVGEYFYDESKDDFEVEDEYEED